MLKEAVERSTKALKCPCGGYAERVACTPEEIKKHGCGTSDLGWDCCARAFLCAVCKERLVGKAEAPEADFS